MSKIAYVNGDFVAEQEAKISIFDRGFLFGDGVYEVVPVVDSHLVNHDAHMQRLQRSLSELQLSAPVALTEIGPIQNELIARNDISEGRVYLQITRGPAERDFAFPTDPQPTLIMFTRQSAVLDRPVLHKGIKVMTVPDPRWQRRDIKTVMLLPASLAKQQAKEQGFDDAWFIEDGYITEGTSNNAYIIKGNTLYTRPLSNAILPGCTRDALLQLCKENDIALKEQAFSLDDAYDADEAFITSASSLVTPVVQIDQHILSNGAPGPLTQRLLEIYSAHVKQDSVSLKS